jgi:hypothetical protein
MSTSRKRQQGHHQELSGHSTVDIELLELKVLDILGDDAEHQNARSMRGFDLAMCMIDALQAEQSARFSGFGLDQVVIEEQPGHNMRSGFHAGDAHSLKMNNISYVMLTAMRLMGYPVVFRSTKRKDVLHKQLAVGADPEEGAPPPVDSDLRIGTEAPGSGEDVPDEEGVVERVAYDAKRHKQNKRRSLLAAKQLSQEGSLALAMMTRAHATRFERRFRCPVPVGLRLHTALDVAGLWKGKSDDKADAFWLAVATALEKLDLIDKPTTVTRSQWQDQLLTDPGRPWTVLAFDVGTRNPAYAVVRVHVRQLPVDRSPPTPSGELAPSSLSPSSCDQRSSIAGATRAKMPRRIAPTATGKTNK